MCISLSLGEIAAIVTIICTAAIPAWRHFAGKNPKLIRYTVTPNYAHGMAHVSLTIRPGNATATIAEVSCPGCKLHYCPSTFTGFTLASPERFADSLAFNIELKSNGSDRDISFLISPIPSAEFLVSLRISETLRSMKYSLKQMQSTTIR